MVDIEVDALGALDENLLARRGLLVRHLVMPGQTDETEAIMRWLAQEISPQTYVNVMGQYRPQYEVGEIARDGKPRYQSINRRPTDHEMTAAYRAVHAAGMSRRFCAQPS